MFSPHFALVLSDLTVYHHSELILNHPYVYIPYHGYQFVSLDSVSICPVSIWEE